MSSSYRYTHNPIKPWHIFYRLWQHVSEALKESDQAKATQEKFLLEEAQRTAAKERKVTHTTYEPALFEVDSLTGAWIYKYSE